MVMTNNGHITRPLTLSSGWDISSLRIIVWHMCAPIVDQLVLSSHQSHSLLQITLFGKLISYATTQLQFTDIYFSLAHSCAQQAYSSIRVRTKYEYLYCVMNLALLQKDVQQTQSDTDGFRNTMCLCELLAPHGTVKIHQMADNIR